MLASTPATVTPLSTSLAKAPVARATSPSCRAARDRDRDRRVEAPAASRWQGGAEALQLAQLLASRVCHDLSGPLGILADAEALMNDGVAGDPEAVALISDSGRRAAARLALFRTAFGFAEDRDAPMAQAALAKLIAGALTSARLRVRWSHRHLGGSERQSALPLIWARLALCLTLLGGEALPRGGEVAVVTGDADDTLMMTITATGPGARLSQELTAAFSAQSCRGLSSRTAVGYYARQIADSLGAAIEIAADGSDAVRFTVVAAASDTFAE